MKSVLQFEFLFVLLPYVPSQQLWSWQDSQFTYRVGVIKIVIVINCNLITFSKVIACNCN